MCNLSVKDLKPGDILVFKGEENEWISKAIMELTDSDVSHAALCYAENELVDEGLKGIGVHAMTDQPQTYFIYARRFKSPSGTPLPMSPVIDVAKNYVTEDEPYNKASLPLLALILLYKKFTPSTPVQRVMIKIFQKAASSIVDLINKKKYPGKYPMVCSQFVFQCYESAPSLYHLVLADTARQLTDASQANTLSTVSEKRFIDLVMEHVTSAPLTKVSAATPQNVTEDDGELARQLLEEIHRGSISVAATPFVLNKKLASATGAFTDAVVCCYNGASCISAESMKVIADNQSMFITPADLKSNISNLDDIGTAWINRKYQPDSQSIRIFGKQPA